MEILNIKHKALASFALTGNPKGLHGNLAERLRKMLTFIAAAGNAEELMTPPNYGAHQLGGDRLGTWALTVTRNWRMTFTITAANEIADLDLEDYH